MVHHVAVIDATDTANNCATNMGPAAATIFAADFADQAPATAGPAQGLLHVPQLSANIVPAGQSGFYFPTQDECRAAAAVVGSFEWNGHEGPVPMLEVGPGIVRLTSPDLNRREQAVNRNADRPLPPMSNLSVLKAQCAGLLRLLRVLNRPVDLMPLLVQVVDLIQRQEQRTSGLNESAETTGDAAPGKIAGWSPKSRRRMISTLAELDLAPLLMQGDDPAMVTLTYPGEWEPVAGDPEEVKRHLIAFYKRYARAWGAEAIVIWKLEFQLRGAPHFHLLMTPPSGVAYEKPLIAHELRVAEWEASGRQGRRPYRRRQVGEGLPFAQWLSEAWADIVAHPDPEERAKHLQAGTAVDYAEGDRARDPKRAAIYFGKHGSFAAKDYQHNVPEAWKKSGKSVGRFWGYRGLSKAKGGATITHDEMLLMGRTLRRYAAHVKVWNPETRTHEFRPALVTKTVARRTVLPDGTIKPAREIGGAMVLDGDDVPVPHLRYRRTTVRARRMTGKNATGFLLVNDGPEMARTLARVVATCAGDGGTPPVGMRGRACDRA